MGAKGKSVPTVLVVTGSSGFIGSHLCESLAGRSGASIVGIDLRAPRDQADPHVHHRADIRSAAELAPAAKGDPLMTVHLAAKAEVVTPLEALPDVVTTNIDGTLTLLRTLRPQRMVFASSCAVYGNTRTAGAKPTWAGVHPIGMYGMSKAVGEMICADWARETGNTAVVLRLGNVIGPRCRGLIPYLVQHALRHPAGEPAAQLRGDGGIIRDYVPVGTVVQAFHDALRLRIPRGQCRTFNVGTGRGTTNRQVAELVQRVLASRGLRLSLNFDAPVAPGEAVRAVLDPRTACRRLALQIPTVQQVEQTIEDAVLSHLADAGAQRPGATFTAGERS